MIESVKKRNEKKVVASQLLDKSFYNESLHFLNIMITSLVHRHRIVTASLLHHHYMVVPLSLHRH